jgi:hypothetical protein
MITNDRPSYRLAVQSSWSQTSELLAPPLDVVVPLSLHFPDALAKANGLQLYPRAFVLEPGHVPDAAASLADRTSSRPSWPSPADGYRNGGSSSEPDRCS